MRLLLPQGARSSRVRQVLLGGPDEHEKNLRLAGETGAFYEGLKSYRDFAGLVGYCDVVVTAVTMALHIAIGLEKKIVLLNNIFNRHEFFLYGLGTIVEPEVPCKACYKQAYDSQCPVPDCMELITVDRVYDSVTAALLGGRPERDQEFTTEG